MKWASPVGSRWAVCKVLHQRTARGGSSRSSQDRRRRWSVGREEKHWYYVFECNPAQPPPPVFLGCCSSFRNTIVQCESDLKMFWAANNKNCTSSSFCMYNGSFRSRPAFSSSVEVGSTNLWRNLWKQRNAKHADVNSWTPYRTFIMGSSWLGFIPETFPCRCRHSHQSPRSPASARRSTRWPRRHLRSAERR